MSTDSDGDILPFIPVVLEVERRVLVRYPWNQGTSCHVTPAKRMEGHWARVLDVSRDGIGIILGCDFRVGTVLLVELHSLAEGFAVTRPARVIHTAPRSDGTWLLGCCFDVPLSQRELEALL